jgi:hypothetical protein
MHCVTSVLCLLCLVRTSARREYSIYQTCLALIPAGPGPDEYHRVGLVFLLDERWLGTKDLVGMGDTFRTATWILGEDKKGNITQVQVPSIKTITII